MCEQCCCADSDDRSNSDRPQGGRAPLIYPSPSIHPGQVLMEEYLRPMGLSIRRLAEFLHIKRGKLESVIGGRSAISTELSMRLGRYFGDPPLYWVDLQVKHEMEMAYCACGEDLDLIRPRVRW